MAKTREELLADAERDYAEVDGVRLQSLTELERSALESLWTERYSKSKTVDMVMRRELLVRSIVDDAGKRMFADSEVALLGAFKPRLVAKLYAEARVLSGFDDGAEVDKQEKKSDETPESN